MEKSNEKPTECDNKIAPGWSRFSRDEMTGPHVGQDQARFDERQVKQQMMAEIERKCDTCCNGGRR